MLRLKAMQSVDVILFTYDLQTHIYYEQPVKNSYPNTFMPYQSQKEDSKVICKQLLHIYFIKNIQKFHYEDW